MHIKLEYDDNIYTFLLYDWSFTLDLYKITSIT